MLNQITIQGRLVRDIELRRTQNNTAVASFCLAVDDDFKDAQGNKTTQFIECVIWRGQAELLARYAQKGAMLIVSGRLQQREYEDRNGQKRRVAEILADRFYLCGSAKSPAQTNAEPQSAYGAPSANFEVMDNSEELPF